MTEPWLDDGDLQLYHGDAASVLADLPAESVQCVVTSPPYHGLRDYGTGRWEGGDPDHDHDRVPHRNGRGGSGGPGKQTVGAFPSDTAATTCSCGARHVDHQLGLEPTVEDYVERLVAVFREVRRVLRADGTVWLNLGDAYAGGSSGERYTGMNERLGRASGARKQDEGQRRRSPADGLKPKDLIGIPWMVAFALRADGWYLRSAITWDKSNPMPESVTDRPTSSYELVFLLAKRSSYFYDQEAVREPHQPDGRRVTTRTTGPLSHENYGELSHTDGRERWPNGGRNMRNVWRIPTQPTPEAHFATYPEELVRRCIMAATSEAGECSACGTPWRRIVQRVVPDDPGRSDGSKLKHADGLSARATSAAQRQLGGNYQKQLDANPAQTIGWEAACECGALAVPQRVLDPFIGSGTTALVARRLGRHAVGIDLNESYLQIAADRTRQLSLLG